MKIKITHDTWLLHHPWNIRAVRVAAFVEAVSNPPRTVTREVGKQIDYFAIVAAAIDQSFDGIAPCPAAFATNNAQTVKPGTKIVERDSAVTRHSVTSERPKRILDRARLLPEQRYAVKDFYPSSVWAINKPLNDGRQHQIRVLYPMKYLFLVFSLILFGSAAAKAADINFGEVRTAFRSKTS
jgi:hypothetical protein